MTIPSVAPKHVEDDEHSEHECNSCVFSLEEEEEPSSHSYCIGSVYEDDINSRMVKTVTVIISHGSIVEEGDYFHTTIDESGRLVYTPNLSINSQNLTTFLPLISNIVQLSTNGDYYIKCQSQPTDEDITAIFGPDCLVQVIKVDAICSYYHDRRIDVSSTDCLRYQQSYSSLSAHSPSSNLPVKTVSASCCPGNADTTFSTSNELLERNPQNQSNLENDLQCQLKRFDEERQQMQIQIESLKSQNQIYCLQAKKHEDEKRNLQDCIKEIESKLHQTSDILMKEIDFISTKVLLLQNELMKACADKAALQEEIKILHARQKQQNGKCTESLQSETQLEELTKNFNDQNRLNSTDRNASTKNKSNPLSLTDAKNISNPSNRWNHHLSAISVRGLKVVQLFHQATSKDVVEPEKHQQTQSSTVSTIRRLSKTSFPEVFHKCKLGPDSSNTTCDKEYDQQDDVDDEDTYEENVNAARNIPNLNDVSSSQTSTSCDDRPRRLTLFRKTL